MRWVSFAGADGSRAGVIAGDQIHALPATTSLLDVLAGGRAGLRAAGERALERPDVVVSLGSVRLLAPIPRPPAIRDFLCFLEHMRGCLRALGRPDELDPAFSEIPAFYYGAPASVIGPRDDVPVAPGSAWFDVELEVGAVLAEGGRDLTPEQGEACIGGYLLFADWSARDLQVRELGTGLHPAKSKDTATTLGPMLVTPDELEPYRRDGRPAIELELEVNGTVLARGRLDAMDWTFGEIIAYASRGLELGPGEVFGSGTVPGGCLLEHRGGPSEQPWLAPGDRVRLRGEGLGELTHTVISGTAPHLLPARTPRRPPRPNLATSRFPYTKGLHKLADGIWAWLLPDGGWGWSNAGLITGDGEALLVDTLFDLPRTREMLAAMAPVTATCPITTAVNTHANGDHCYGNELLDPAVRIVAAEGTAAEIPEVPPSMLGMLATADLDPTTSAYLRPRFGHFQFDNITLRLPDDTFTGEWSGQIGGRAIQARDLGPAHTRGDTIVYVPDASTLFAGDLLFIGGTPIMWAGPIENWIAACDAMLALDPEIVVPGHGPVTDADGIRGVRAYLDHVREQTHAAHDRGLDYRQAAFGIDLGDYASLPHAERVVVTVHAVYRALEPDQPDAPVITLLQQMAQWDAERNA